MTLQTVVRIVDDDPAVREGLAFVLESEGWLVASYESAEAFLRDDRPSAPGCLILDINMPSMTGIELQHVMRDRGYNLPIIFLTGHGDIDMAVAAIKYGAVEFLQKTGDNTRLIDAVRKAVAYSRAGFAELDIEPFEAIGRCASLTERERLIADMIASGLLNRQIAERLGISVRTVETHRGSIFRKLGIKTTAELSRMLAMADEHKKG